MTSLPLGLLAALAHQGAWMLGPFVKAGVAITPQPGATFRSPMNDSIVRWEEHATFNPAAVVRDGKVVLLYRAEDLSGAAKIGGHTSRLGLAESGDGLQFTRRGTPVLYPDTDAQRRYEWPGGVEDPRLVETEDGTYVLTYTQWNRDIPRLAVATSRDLIHWTKHGPAFAAAAGGKYRDLESKSGAIVAHVVGDHLIATPVAGKYWMYFNVPHILIATSDNLIDWRPLEDMNGGPFKVLSPRPDHFDSWLVEAGPPAILTDRGIVLLYNTGNSACRRGCTPAGRRFSIAAIRPSCSPGQMTRSSRPPRTTSGRGSTRRARRSSKGWCRFTGAGFSITARPIRAWAWRCGIRGGDARASCATRPAG